MTVGAAVSINALRTFIAEAEVALAAQGGAHRTRGLAAVRAMLSWFASNQIRNVACVGGNIVTASPISDLNPLLLALGATLRFRSLDSVSARSEREGGERRVEGGG